MNIHRYWYFFQDKNGENTGTGDENTMELPTTLEDFSHKSSQPKIYDPPKAPENPKETAPQR
jgi:hypothetical protein